MCKRCIDIDNKIDRYRRITLFTDELTRERVAGLIDDLQAEKATLHPEQRKTVPRI